MKNHWLNKDKKLLFEKLLKENKSEAALQLAATAWCKPKTQNKIMDTELAEAFAEIIEGIWDGLLSSVEKEWLFK